MTAVMELRELDDDELTARLGESRRELFNLRFRLATGQLDDSSRLGEAKKDIARILTLLRDREIAEAEGRAPSSPALSSPKESERRERRERAVAAAAEAEDEVDDVSPNAVSLNEVSDEEE